MSAYLDIKDLEPFDLRMLEYVEETSEAERTTHQASCHCGAVQYSVTLKWPFPKYTVNACNCSICIANSYLLVYPARRDVVFTKGYENLNTYCFHTNRCTHKFCRTCGSSLLVELGKPAGIKPEEDTMAINVRFFKNIDLSKLKYTSHDGKNLL